MLYTLIIAIAAGIWITAICRKLNFPSIVMLLLGGIALGPEGLALVQADDLGELLEVIVSLAVAVILFEGGLSLDFKGFQSSANVIQRLLTTGVVTTWLATTAAIWFLFDHSLEFSFLAASLVIVTGPTVINPLLRRIHLQTNLHHILHWEGVLIDAVGVFVALLCFEAFQLGSGQLPLLYFFTRIMIGVSMGFLGGWCTLLLFRLRAIPEDMKNLFALSSALLVFGLADVICKESGILAVTVAGLALGSKDIPALRSIRQFKSELTDLLIGMLFIVLAARLRFEQFEAFGLRGVILLAILLFAIRPLNVLLSTRGSSLSIREKIFLGWMAPRGIVAASMAALFSIQLEHIGGVEDPRFLETFVFSVILTTVILNGLTAGLLANWLGVRRKLPTGWIIVGASSFGRHLSQFIHQHAGVPVLLCDINAQLVAECRASGLRAIQIDATQIDMYEQYELFEMGNLLAVTDNKELNELLCLKWQELFGDRHVFRWSGDAMPSHAHSFGYVVFEKLPKPSLLSLEIDNGVTTLITLSPKDISKDLIGIPLIITGLSSVTFPADPGQCNTARRDARILWMERESLLHIAVSIPDSLL